MHKCIISIILSDMKNTCYVCICIFTVEKIKNHEKPIHLHLYQRQVMQPHRTLPSRVKSCFLKILNPKILNGIQHERKDVHRDICEFSDTDGTTYLSKFQKMKYKYSKKMHIWKYTLPQNEKI